MGSAHILLELGCDVVKCDTELHSVLGAGILNSQYREIIVWLASKIKHYGGFEETVDSKDDLTCLAMEISSFLKEMMCVYKVLLEGPMSSRYRTPNDARLLAEYLSSECALYFILNREPLTIIPREPPTPTEVLAEICENLDIKIEDVQCSSLFGLIIEKISSSQQDRSKLLFNPAENLSNEQWCNLEECYSSLLNEYNLRFRMMLVRVDTTIDSFRWKQATAVPAKDEFKVKRPILCKLAEALAMKDISLLLATDETVLDEEKIGSTRLKGSGKNAFRGYLELLDRGGKLNIDETPIMPHFTSREEGQESENLRKRLGKVKLSEDNAEL